MERYITYLSKIVSSDEIEMSEKRSLKEFMTKQGYTGDELKVATALVKYVMLFQMMLMTKGFVVKSIASKEILFVFDLEDVREDMKIEEKKITDFIFSGSGREIDGIEGNVFIQQNANTLTKVLFGPSYAKELVNMIGTFNIFDSDGVKFTEDYIMQYGERDFRIWHQATYSENDKSSENHISSDHSFIMELGLSFIYDLKRYNSNDKYTYPIEFSADKRFNPQLCRIFTSYIAKKFVSIYSESDLRELNLDYNTITVMGDMLDSIKELLVPEDFGFDLRDFSIKWSQLMEYTISTNPWFLRKFFSMYYNAVAVPQIKRMIEISVEDGEEINEEYASHLTKFLKNQFYFVFIYFCKVHNEFGYLSISIITDAYTEYSEKSEYVVGELVKPYLTTNEK